MRICPSQRGGGGVGLRLGGIAHINQDSAAAVATSSTSIHPPIFLGCGVSLNCSHFISKTRIGVCLCASKRMLFSITKCFFFSSFLWHLVSLFCQGSINHVCFWWVSGHFFFGTPFWGGEITIFAQSVSSSSPLFLASIISGLDMR